MSSTTITKNATPVTDSCSWEISNGYGDTISYTVSKMSNDGQTFTEVSTFDLLGNGAGDNDVDYTIASDGIYILTYTEIAVNYVIPIVATCSLVNCIALATNKIICGTLEKCDVDNGFALFAIVDEINDLVEADTNINNLTVQTEGSYETNSLPTLKLINEYIIKAASLCSTFNTGDNGCDCGC